jgi:hypothetical protein
LAAQWQASSASKSQLCSIALRGKFQFWTFGYPTGDPVALSALRLRDGLRKTYEVYPETKSMVMVSYSLGGLVGKMQVQTTGDAVWQEVFKGDSARLKSELPADSPVRRALVFEANPRVKRIVFICTPHLDSPLAPGFWDSSVAALSSYCPSKPWQGRETWP